MSRSRQAANNRARSSLGAQLWHSDEYDDRDKLSPSKVNVRATALDDV